MQQGEQTQSVQQDMSVILVTAGYDHTIRFWEAWSGICGRTINQQPHWIATLESHQGNVTAIAFHCEGKWLATGSEDGTIKIWDTRTAGIQRDYYHGSPVNDVVVHPNQGELISCDQNGSVKIWDLGENSCTHELVPLEDVPIRSGNVFVWKIKQGNDLVDLQPVTMFQAHNKYLTRCLLSPDTKHLATCSADKTVKIWSTENYEYKLERTLEGHQRWVWDAAFSADSAYLVTASSDHVARLWDLNSGETVRQYSGHHRAAVCCALNDINLT
ncbi:hypothetical protein QFC21_000326 [Naganishia friedmannii]|uniref:Uncharacterized protein n=1 Tax=Naganishia friedmannii TaxID=89922 RepID=A0ACC2WB66_9TREE|nr:hypothetical protein QFC21_000326 [Naganishia friedmannii]